MDGYEELQRAMRDTQRAGDLRLDLAVERYKATAAAYRGPIDAGIRLERKGATLLVVRGERSELRRAN
jgi:hypothetical protein